MASVQSTRQAHLEIKSDLVSHLLKHPSAPNMLLSSLKDIDEAVLLLRGAGARTQLNPLLEQLTGVLLGVDTGVSRVAT